MKQRLSSLWSKLKSFRIPHHYWLWETISICIASPLVLISAILYVQEAIKKTPDKFFGLGLSVIGVTLALAALSGQIASITNKEDETYKYFSYATDKFSHSSLLLVQTIIAVFARDTLLDFDWISASKILRLIVSFLSSIVIFYVSSYGAWSWYWGFKALNSALWLRSRHPKI